MREQDNRTRIAYVPAHYMREHLEQWLRDLPTGTDLGTGTAIADGLPATIRKLYDDHPSRIRGALYQLLRQAGPLTQAGLLAKTSTGYCKPGLPEEPAVPPQQAAGNELESRPAPMPEPATSDNGHHDMAPLAAALEENRQHGVSVRKFINSMADDFMDALGDTGYRYQFTRDETGGGSLTWKNPGTAA